MIEFEDLPMVINMIPRLVVLTDLTKLELYYQIRLKGKSPFPIRDGEEDESKQRLRAMEEIRKSFSDRERDWLLTHKEDVKEIMNPDAGKKKKRVKE